LLTSCSNNASGNEEKITKQLAEINKEIERLDSELKNFQIQLAEKTKKMSELEEVIEFLKNSENEVNNQQSTLLAMNEQLIKNLPDITKRYGYILEINGQEKFMMMDYANWEIKQDEPNGGHIVDLDGNNERINIHPNVEVYVLDGTSISHKPFEEFDLAGHQGLYDLYLINNQVVLIAEKYIP
jgi:hypothetical protein